MQRHIYVIHLAYYTYNKTMVNILRHIKQFLTRANITKHIKHKHGQVLNTY